MFLDHRFKPMRLRQVRIYPGSLSFSERDRNQLESLPRGPRHFSIEPPTPTQPTPLTAAWDEGEWLHKNSRLGSETKFTYSAQVLAIWGVREISLKLGR